LSTPAAFVDSRSAYARQIARPVVSIRVISRALSRAVLAFIVFLGAFVINEPAPYELLLVVSMGGFLIFGLRLSNYAVSLATLFLLFNIGGMISMFQMDSFKEIPLYLMVSLFLGLSSVFFCAVIEADMGRLRTINRAYVVGAMITALLGILGYFNAFPGAEVFTLYDRAKGAFQDPNVFGPFLVLPALYLSYGLLQRKFTLAPLRAAILLILLIAILLSFSRAAWGLIVISGAILYGLQFAGETSGKKRLQMLIIMVVGVTVLILFLLVALQFDAVGNMFNDRAIQEYDGGSLGRFARHAIGFGWALEMPLGIGPLEFGLALGQDTHNIWLKALMDYGWLGFASYLTMTIWTLFGPARQLLAKRPWTPYLQVAWAAFIGHIIIAWVIDIDHWRHVYLMIGIIWGCMALEKRWQISNPHSQ